MNKEYEMPDEYQRQLAQVVQMIEQRDEFARQIPSLPPEARAMAKPALAELSSAIESAEQKLADEYQRYQAERRLEDERRLFVDDGKPLEGEALEAFNKGVAAMERIFIFTKYKRPHLLEKFKTEVLGGLPPDLLEEFYEGAARREALELDEILKEK